jgi:RNA polymerase sigma factor (sigma-70 family)
MAPPDDELFRIFLTTGEESPFAELVRRHLGLVHSAAMRITCQTELAEEVSQLVFTKLAQVRSPLATGLSIVTWLHRTTRSTAIDLVRAESRRRKREKTAASLAMDQTSIPWDEISPILDDVIHKLAEDERHAVLCRFFEGQSHADIARSLGLSKDAARMRVNRALEKIRILLGKKGIATTASALAVALPSYVFAAPPTSLASTVASTALASLTPSLSIITIGIGTMTKKAAITITALLIASAGTAAYLKLQPAPAAAHSGAFLRKDLMDPSGAGRSDTRQTTNKSSRAERERIAKHNEMLERLSKEATAAAKKSFAASLSLPPPTISITSGGDLSPSVIDSFSLSASEVESLKTVVSEARSKEAKMFAGRAELIPGTGEQDGASFKYLVRAKRDRGAAEIKQLAEKVGQILDDPRSKQFMAGVGEFDFYAGFGKYDMEVIFYSENGVDMVKYQYLDPASGKPTRFGKGKLDDPNYGIWKAVDPSKH